MTPPFLPGFQMTQTACAVRGCGVPEEPRDKATADQPGSPKRGWRPLLPPGHLP